MRKSRVVLFFLSCFIAGVAFRSFFTIPVLYVAIVAFVGVSAAAVVWWKSSVQEFEVSWRHISRAYAWVVLLCGPLFILAGVVRFESALLPTATDDLAGSCSSFEERPISCLNESSTLITGTIVREPDIRDYNVQYIISVDGYAGYVLLFASLYPLYAYGDHLEIRCLLETPEAFDGFDYPGYLAKEGVYSVCRYADSVVLNTQETYTLLSHRGIIQQLLLLKQKLHRAVNDSVLYPESAIINSLVLGIKQEIPEQLRDQFSRTGTSHIMAISGMHLVILTSIVYALFRGLRLHKKHAFIFSIVLMVLFIGIIGFRASAIRAGIFACMAILGEVVGRPRRALIILLFSASVLLLLNPLLLRYDAGFQLSFMAVAGLMYLGPVLRIWFSWVPEFLGLRDIGVMTISAQLGVLPLIIFHFGTVSVVSVLANLLVLPVIPYIMMGGLLVIGTSAVSLAAAQWVGVAVSMLISYMLYVLGFLSGLSFSSIEYSLSTWEVMAVYGCGILVFLPYTRVFVSNACKRIYVALKYTKVSPTPQTHGLETDVIHEEFDMSDFEPQAEFESTGSIKTGYRYIYSSISRISPYRVLLIVLVLLLAIAALLFFIPFRDDADFRVAYLDVGQGDSQLILAPGNQQILIDGGPDQQVLEKLHTYMPAGDRTIELMILTHPHADHITGLTSVLDRYHVDHVLATGVSYSTHTYQQWLDALSDQDIDFDHAQRGVMYNLETPGAPVEVTVLYPLTDLYETVPADLNDSSVVVTVDYSGYRFLFTGDISGTIEQQLVSYGDDLKSDILKVAHHGSDTSSSSVFITEVDPAYAVIPVGENSYGHPSDMVINRLMNLGAEVFQTKTHGDVVFVVDDSGLRLEK